MHKPIVALLVMLLIVFFSYHTLVDLHCESQITKTAMAKKLVRETGVSVREAERRLNAYLFLDEIPQWESGGPHCPYLLQEMFTQAENAGWKGYNCIKQRGCLQSTLEHDISQETSGVELVGYRITHKKVFSLYQEVYQLKRTPGPVPGDQEVANWIYQEILNSLMECIQHRQSPTQPEEALEHRSRKPAQATFHSWNKVNWDHFDCYWDRQNESPEEALRVTRDVHHQALVVAALLEGHIISLHHSVSHG